MALWVRSRARWIGILVLVAGVWGVAWWQYERLPLQREVADAAPARRLARAPLVWTFQTASDLQGDSHSLADRVHDENGMHFRAADADPYFTLNLHGRLIPDRFNVLTVTMTADEAGRMQVFHQAREVRDFILASHWIDVKPGKHCYRVVLDHWAWHPLPVTEAGLQKPRPAARWGSDSGVIAGLRLDPIDRAGAAVTVHRLTVAAETSPEEACPSGPAGDQPPTASGSNNSNRA